MSLRVEWRVIVVDIEVKEWVIGDEKLDGVDEIGWL